MSSIRVLPVNRNIAEGTLTEKALGDFYEASFVNLLRITWIG